MEDLVGLQEEVLEKGAKRILGDASFGDGLSKEQADVCTAQFFRRGYI